MTDSGITIPIDPEAIGADRSLLSPNKFQVEISKFPQLTIYAQSLNIPSITLPVTKVPTSAPEEYFLPGDRLEFSDWVLTIPVNKFMDAYITILNWITTLPVNMDKNPLSDISVLMLTNNNNLNKTMTIHNAFPYSMSEIRLTTTEDEDTVPVVDISFKFSDFTIN